MLRYLIFYLLIFCLCSCFEQDQRNNNSTQLKHLISKDEACSDHEFSDIIDTIELIIYKCSSYRLDTIPKQLANCEGNDCTIIREFVNKFTPGHDNYKQPMCSHTCCEVLHLAYNLFLKIKLSCFTKLQDMDTLTSFIDKSNIKNSNKDISFDNSEINFRTVFRVQMIRDLKILSKQFALNKVVHYVANISTYCKGFRCFWNHSSSHLNINDSFNSNKRNEFHNDKEKSIDSNFIENNLKNNSSQINNIDIHIFQNQTCLISDKLQSLSMNLRISCMHSLGMMHLCSNPECCQAVIQYQYTIEQLPSDSPCFNPYIGTKENILDQLRGIKEKINSKCNDGEYLCLGTISGSNKCKHTFVNDLENKDIENDSIKLDNNHDKLKERNELEYKFKNQNIHSGTDLLLQNSFIFYKQCKFHSESFCSPKCCQSLNSFERLIIYLPDQCYISEYDSRDPIDLDNKMKAQNNKFDESITDSIPEGVIMDWNAMEGDSNRISNKISFKSKLSRSFLLQLLDKKRKLVNTQCAIGCPKIF